MITADFNNIKSLWNQNRCPVNLYINSPFCVSNCNYCVYKGYTKSIKEERKHFFEEYLPNQVKKYLPILKDNQISSLYFGGGTPNYNGNLQQLQPSLDLLENIKGERLIELHMGFEISDENIEFLAKNKFTVVVLCQQTFNKEILKQQNRVNLYQNNMDTLIKKFHDKNIKVAVDLIAFDCAETYNDEVFKDLDIISNFSNLPDEITISLEYSKKSYCNCERGYLKIRNHPLFKNYIAEIGNNYRKEVLYHLNVFRFFKKEIYKEFQEKRFFSFTDGLSEQGIYPKAILGIGTYKNTFRSVYSRIPGICTYSEEYKDGKTYYNVQEYCLKQQLHNLIDWIFGVCDKYQLPYSHALNISVSLMDSRHENHYENFKEPMLIPFEIFDSQNNYINNVFKEELKNTPLKNILLEG